MRRRSIESRTGRSKGCPFRVVVVIADGGALKFGGWNLLLCLVAVKLRIIRRGFDRRGVMAVRVKTQKERIQLDMSN